MYSFETLKKEYNKMKDSLSPIYFQKRFSNLFEGKKIYKLSPSHGHAHMHKLPLSDKEIMILFIYILHRDPCS